MGKLGRSVVVAAVVVAAVGGTVVVRALTGDDQDPAHPPAARPTSGVAGSAPEPVVAGSRLLDARTGTAYVPHGVNWSGFEYACTQGWGYSPLDRLGTDAGAHEAATIASWGADLVRVPLNQDCWLGTRGAPVSDGTTTRDQAGYRDAVAGFVADLHHAGLAVVLDLQSRKRVDENEFGNVAMPDADSLEFWSSVAHEYADDPAVIFDAFNEPYSRYDDAAGTWAFQLDWPCWRDGGCSAPITDDRTTPVGSETYPVVGMAAAVAAIRAAGATQPIVLSGLDYANDVRFWLDQLPGDPQLIAGVHYYPGKRCADVSCWDSELLPILEQRPVLATEIGNENASDRFVETFANWAKPHQIGWLAWSWDDHAGNPLALVGTDRTTPTDPYGQLVKQLLGAAR